MTILTWFFLIQQEPVAEVKETRPNSEETGKGFEKRTRQDLQ